MIQYLSVKCILLRELPNDNLKDDKYVNELQGRIEQGRKIKENTEREPEPATIISPEKFFMRMAKLSQKRPGDFQYKAVSHSLIHNHNYIQDDLLVRVIYGTFACGKLIGEFVIEHAQIETKWWILYW